jgi:hypothetical protein
MNDSGASLTIIAPDSLVAVGNGRLTKVSGFKGKTGGHGQLKTRSTTQYHTISASMSISKDLLRTKGNP